MICLNDTDTIEAWSDTAAVIDYNIFGLVGTAWIRLASGVLGNAADVVIYTAGAATAIVSIQFTNIGGAAATVNLKIDPTDGGNSRFMLPKAVSLAAGYTLVTDGAKFSTMNTGGRVLTVGPSPLAVEDGGTGLTTYAVGDLIYASGATTLSKLADVAVGQYLASGGVGVAPAWAALNQAAVAGLTTGSSPVFVTAKLSGLTDGYVPYHVNDATGLANSVIFTDGTGVGINTATIPHGGLGMAKFAIEGTNASTAGPHIQWTTNSDDFPIVSFMVWRHDTIKLYFDAYYDDLSSDAGSNYMIMKSNDLFRIQYDSGIAQGAAITWNDGFILDVTGGVHLPNIKSGINQGAAGAAAGELWFDTDDDNTVKMGV